MAALVLRIVGLAESTYYERKKRKERSTERSVGQKGRPHPGYSLSEDGQKISDEQMKEWLLELVEGEEHVYGYKLLADCLWNEHKLILNHKKCYRLCKELGILQKQRPKKSKHPRRLAKNQLVTGPNQLWQMDIKYGYVAGRDRFIFVLSIIDGLDRVVVGQYRGAKCEAIHVCHTLGKALDNRIKPGQPLPVIRTDNGPQFVSNKFGDMCESLEIIHERIPPKTPNLNAYIESFHSILERDLFSKQQFASFEEAYEAVDEYMHFYNNRRMHGSLRRLPPMKFLNWFLQLEDGSKFHKAV